jgi:DNA-binding Xre family transcriptional regulator
MYWKWLPFLSVNFQRNPAVLPLQVQPATVKQPINWPFSTNKRKKASFFIHIPNNIIKFATNAIHQIFEMKDLNRIKVVLTERKKTNKWLATELGKDPATVSKWCTNSSQPDLSTLKKIALALGVDIRSLLVPTPQKSMEDE